MANLAQFLIKRYRPRLRITRFLLSSICLWQMSPVYAETPWIVYYASAEKAEAFLPYDVVIIDNDYPNSISMLVEDGKIVLGYLSLTEVSRQRPYFEQLRREQLLLSENKNWPGTYGIDIRDKRWKELIIYTLIPQMLQRGFSGIFIDTLDNAAEWERTDPLQFEGMRRAALDIIKTIRNNFPYVKLMVNRGYDLIPRLGDTIDYILVESSLTTYDFDTKSHSFLPPDDYDRQVAQLRAFQRQFPRLQVMTLDYWPTDDGATMAKIYAIQSGNGFSPYVASIGLDRVIPRPEPR